MSARQFLVCLSVGCVYFLDYIICFSDPFLYAFLPCCVPYLRNSALIVVTIYYMYYIFCSSSLNSKILSGFSYCSAPYSLHYHFHELFSWSVLDCLWLKIIVLDAFIILNFWPICSINVDWIELNLTIEHLPSPLPIFVISKREYHLHHVD